MVGSDEVGLTRAGVGRRVVIGAAVVLGASVLSAILVIAYLYWGIWKFQDHANQLEIDLIEEALTENRAAFEEQASYLTELGQSEPDAAAARWSSQMCFAGAGGDEWCREATSREEQISDGTPRAGGTVWQEKDDGRVFFWFVKQPCYLMFDPQERNAKDFATEHGFRWERDLGDGWSILCHIEDEEQRHAMWVHEVF